MGMSWAAATDLGRNSGTVSGWMNLWGNIGALISPLLGLFVEHLGWTMTFQLLIVPAVIAVIMWFYVKPDQPLIVSDDKAIEKYLIMQAHIVGAYCFLR